MFGAPVAYFFEHLLGIRQPEGCAGYKSLIIEPQAVSSFGRMSGSIQIPSGKVAVKHEKTCDGIHFKITVPVGVEAIFRYANVSKSFSHGENEFYIKK